MKCMRESPATGSVSFNLAEIPDEAAFDALETKSYKIGPINAPSSRRRGTSKVLSFLSIYRQLLVADGEVYKALTLP